MTKNPLCRYSNFKKRCPEKPYYIRQEYPFGTPSSCNEDGCIHWHIENMHDITSGKDFIVQGCIDMFTAFYMRDYGIRALGNQRATEQLRNGLCENINGQLYPKVHPIEIALTQALKHIVEIESDKNINLIK